MVDLSRSASLGALPPQPTNRAHIDPSGWLMVIAGREGPNQRAHLQQGEGRSFLAVGLGWDGRAKQELKSISALIFSRPPAKLGAFGDTPPHQRGFPSR